MVHETIDGTYRQTNLTNESPEYLAAREELRKAEIGLMQQRDHFMFGKKQSKPCPMCTAQFYSVHPRLDHDIKERGSDAMTPIWNVLDLTPQGRGTFYASLDYGTKVQAARR